MKPTVIAVAGPTATGKTRVGAELASLLRTEVVSADSQLVYKELDIGTAKPTEAEKRGIPHHMIDVVAPTVAYSAARYREDALPILSRLHAEGKIPVLVGGTGFYLRALLQGEYYAPVAPNPELREQLKAETPEALYQRLQTLDPERASALHPNDTYRVIRALEIVLATGKPVPPTSSDSPFNIHWIVLDWQDRPQHGQLIDARVDEMLAAGWVEEVQGLVNRYGPDAHALQVAHGYPELVRHVLGEMTLADARAKICDNVRRYAKRQRTWFRQQAQGSLQWVYVDNGLPTGETLLKALNL